MTYLEVTLKFKASLYTEREEPVDLNRIAECLSADHYNGDGRFPLMEEMLTHAIEQLLKSAACDADVRACREKYGQEMVEVGEGCRQNRAYLEAGKLKPLSFGMDLPFQATIEEVQP